MILSVNVVADATTFDARYSEAELHLYGIELTCEERAQVICADSIEKLAQCIVKYRSNKKYLVWCDEPLWSTLWTELALPLVYWSSIKNSLVSRTDEYAVPVHVMNCFTGDVFSCNKTFLTKEYALSSENVFDRKNNYFAPKVVGAFLTFRADDRYDYSHPCGVKGLSKLRTLLAYDLYRRGVCDIYGPNWPAGVAIYNDRIIDGVYHTNFTRKLSDLQNYKFCLALENTKAQYYVTEKIWHSISAGCVPIYYGGKTNSIYQDFPEESFIDYAEINNPEALYRLITTMSQEEYVERFSRCSEVLVRSAVQSGYGAFPKKIQLTYLRNKLFYLMMQ
jgi:hypothetical protein